MTNPLYTNTGAGVKRPIDALYRVTLTDLSACKAVPVIRFLRRDNRSHMSLHEAKDLFHQLRDNQETYASLTPIPSVDLSRLKAELDRGNVRYTVNMVGRGAIDWGPCHSCKGSGEWKLPNDETMTCLTCDGDCKGTNPWAPQIIEANP